MCGISGIYKLDGDCGPVERSLVERMNRRLVHRGPDDQGFHVSGPIALGHRRLSIVDLTGGKQPISNEDGTVSVVFNGEIYNYRSLRQELVRKGHCFTTRSDTEVIVHLYEELGEGVFRELNGMFAIALWDARNKKLILARDRIGKKPLYYHANQIRLAFASEMKALLALPDCAIRVDPGSLDHYLSFFYVPSPRTILTDVAKVEPATYLVCERGKIRKERYWQIDFTRRYPGTRVEATDELRSLVEDAVKIRLESEVPLGAFLSGGVDSSATVALMAGLMRQPVRTTSIGFGDSAYHELAYARVVAAHCRTDHREESLKPNFIEHLARVVYHLDEPFADSSALPTYLLCQAARRHVTVAISGDGGDENFAGYDRYRAALMEEQWRDILPAGCRRFAFLLADALLSPLCRGFTPLHNLNADLIAAAARTVSCFANEFKKDLYRPTFGQQINGAGALEMFRDGFLHRGDLPPLSRLQAFDFAYYLPDDILTKVDRMSMAHSLEVRAPLLDYRIAEFGASLPPEWKSNYTSGKLIFKEAMKPLLPPEICARTKSGFSIPAGSWFRKQWRPLGEKFILSERFADRGYFQPAAVRKIWEYHQRPRPWRLDLGERLWTLLILEVWHRIFVDGDSVEGVTQELRSSLS